MTNQENTTNDWDTNSLPGTGMGPHQGEVPEMAKATTKDAGTDLAALIRERNKLEEQIAELRAGAIQEFKADMEAKAAELEVNILDLFSPPKPVKKGKGISEGPPKYLNPATGETFSGRGRTARWLAELIVEGKKMDDYLNPDWVRANQ